MAGNVLSSVTLLASLVAATGGGLYIAQYPAAKTAAVEKKEESKSTICNVDNAKYAYTMCSEGDIVLFTPT